MPPVLVFLLRIALATLESFVCFFQSFQDYLNLYLNSCLLVISKTSQKINTYIEGLRNSLTNFTECHVENILPKQLENIYYFKCNDTILIINHVVPHKSGLKNFQVIQITEYVL